MISYDEAFGLVRNTSRFVHSLTVSAIMRNMAKKLCENEQEWALVGLLHDLDYDDVRGDMSQHGVLAAGSLQCKLPEHCIYAIKAHDQRTGFRPQSRLDKALMAADSAALVIEIIGKRNERMDAETLITSLENLSSFQPWHKNNVQKCTEIGLEVDEFLRLCLDSKKKRE